MRGPQFHGQYSIYLADFCLFSGTLQWDSLVGFPDPWRHGLLVLEDEEVKEVEGAKHSQR